MRWHSRYKRRHDEQGAVAVIVAFSMTALLVIAALVVDVGQARTDRLSNRTYTDAAAASGIRSLDSGDGISKPYHAACTALAYLKASDAQNLTSLVSVWRTGAGAAVVDPCGGTALLDSACVPNTASSWAWYHGTATTASGKLLTIDIKGGYQPQAVVSTALGGYAPQTDDAAFHYTGPTDNGVGASGGCDQLAVIMQEQTQPGLGQVASSNPLITKVRTVARMTASSLGDASAALLILERTDCPAIQVNSTNTHIEVLGFGSKPGVIHSDSSGTGATCSPINPVILGKFASAPGVSAHQSESGTPRLPGMITTVAGGTAPANATDGATKVCAETALPAQPPQTFPPTAPTSCGPALGRGLVGRGVVDRRYDTSTTTGVQLAMSTAATEYNKVPTGAAPGTLASYTVLGGSQKACQNVANSNYTQGGAIFVNCPNGVNYNDFTFTNATAVVFNGNVSVGSGNTLSMPNVTRLYIKGGTGPQGGFQASGTFNYNLGLSATCALRGTTARAQIVVGSGSFSAGAQSSLHLCQTTVLMANDQSPTCPLPPTPVVGPGPPPADNSCIGNVNLNAGGTMDWSAPDSVFNGPASQTDWNNLEDLALWTETSQESSIGGGGSMTLTGVFFLPNANPFTISGHGNQLIPANAQFVARKLQAKGQGTLYMRPDPNDSFTLPLVSDSFNLVR
ncbi:MAG: hypothetical protein QOI06_2271 [Nocardioidaceae bacterium]|jgi:Flp pilus assembly protein TadG|nr:hypothetical protein [Nocardioidaceae bacterium]